MFFSAAISYQYDQHYFTYSMQFAITSHRTKDHVGACKSVIFQKRLGFASPVLHRQV